MFIGYTHVYGGLDYPKRHQMYKGYMRYSIYLPPTLIVASHMCRYLFYLVLYFDDDSDKAESRINLFPPSSTQFESKQLIRAQPGIQIVYYKCDVFPAVTPHSYNKYKLNLPTFSIITPVDIQHRL